MFVSRKTLKAMEQRISELETNSTANTYAFGKVNLQKLTKIIEEMKKPSVIADSFKD